MGSVSSSVVNEINEAVYNIALSSVQKCVTSTDQEQNTTINMGGGLFNNTTVSQTTSVSSSCTANSSFVSDLQNKIISAISNNAKAKAAFGVSVSEAETNIRNTIRANVNFSSIQENMTMIKQKQNTTVNVSGVQIGSNININQGAEVFAASVQKSVADSGIYNTIKNSIDNSSDAKGFDPLGDMSTTFIYLIIAFFAFILIIVVVILVI